MLDITLESIKDANIRDAFYNILEEFRSQSLLNFGFKFYEVTFDASVTNYRFLHRLKFKPKDAIITAITGNGTAYFDLNLSDNTHLDITTTDACTIRFLLGNLDVNSAA